MDMYHAVFGETLFYLMIRAKKTRCAEVTHPRPSMTVFRRRSTMPNTFHRKPIANFFVKRSLQLKLVFNIVIVVLFTTFASLATMVLVYFIKYKTVLVYQLDKVTQDLSREHIVFLILPTLLFSALVNLLLALGIGFYASRKYAIPIYKLEQWCSLLLKGKMTAMLLFREKEELKDLSSKCNELTSSFRERFTTIRQQTLKLKEEFPDSPTVKKIEESLNGLDLSTDPIEVNTGYYKLAMKQDGGKK
jgi:hypothetical protein